MLKNKLNKSKIFVVILVYSVLMLSAFPASAESKPVNYNNYEKTIEYFDVVSYNTKTESTSYKTYDTSLTTYAVRDGKSEVSSPAYMGSAKAEENSCLTRSNVARNIIGSDSRQRIVSPESYHPYRAICRIVTYWDKNNDGTIDNSVGVATGFLEGPSAVVSNGHVIYDHNLEMWCKYAEVTFAQDGSESAPYGTQRSTTIHTSVAWIENGDANQDWAIIEINDDIGYSTGWFGKLWTKGTLTNREVTVTGYPGDHPHTMWTSSGIITNTYSARVEHNCDTTPGQSGSPIYNSSNQILAIHSSGGSQYNGGVRITEWLFNLLEEYRP